MNTAQRLFFFSLGLSSALTSCAPEKSIPAANRFVTMDAPILDRTLGYCAVQRAFDNETTLLVLRSRDNPDATDDYAYGHLRITKAEHGRKMELTVGDEVFTGEGPFFPTTFPDTLQEFDLDSILVAPAIPPAKTYFTANSIGLTKKEKKRVWNGEKLGRMEEDTTNKKPVKLPRIVTRVFKAKAFSPPTKVNQNRFD